MVEWDGRDRSRRNGARGRAGTWPSGDDVLRPAAPPLWPAFTLSPRVAAVRAWVHAEAVPGRLLPWLTVAFGLGITLYFAADHEPLWWAPSALSALLLGAAIAARKQTVAFVVTLVAAAIALGFAAATLKTARIAHPVLQEGVWNAEVAGFVETREERERSDRIAVRVTKLEAPRITEKPERIRVSVRKGTAPEVGAHVSFKARLSPPPAPMRPGGYDFARDLYFQQIGATGFVLGSIAVSPAPEGTAVSKPEIGAIASIRNAIDARIRANVDGDRGAIASALITGKRDAISAQVNDAMYVSSLAHVLSISGYHMAVVAGVVFFTLRALLALVPGFAVRRPIKKWSALGALVFAAFYLALSGAEVATQRAFIMTAIVLLGVMLDRAALTLRTLSLAALAVMAIAPEAVVHPSFQMSFAATLALVAAYERGIPWSADANTTRAARMALWGAREVTVLVIASVVAGFATTLYAAFHFNRIAPYGVLANLAAMPLVSAWVMPSGLLALVAMPFGLDGLLWRLMGEGIAAMVAVATFVAALPGSIWRVPSFGVTPLLLGTGGLLLLCLLKTPLRWSGAAVGALAIVLAALAPKPDVLIAADGQSFAVRGADGRLSLHRAGSDAFAARSWLAADGDGRTLTDLSLQAAIRCDDDGCVGTLADGALVARPATAEALIEDCRLAHVVVTPRAPPPGCRALVIDRRMLNEQGALALTATRSPQALDTNNTTAASSAAFAIRAARPKGEDRPWARARQQQVAPASADQTTRATPLRRPPVDATPRSDDLEPGD